VPIRNVLFNVAQDGEDSVGDGERSDLDGQWLPCRFPISRPFRQPSARRVSAIAPAKAGYERNVMTVVDVRIVEDYFDCEIVGRLC